MKKYIFRTILFLLIAIIPVINGIELFYLSKSEHVSGNEICVDISPETLSVIEVEKYISNLIEERERKEEELRAGLEREERYEHFLESIEKGETSFRQAFSDSLILGDSLIQGLKLYEVLNGSNILARVGVGLDHFEGNIEKIIANNPKKLIAHYGFNGVKSLQNCESFILRYKEIITKIKKELPDTDIYVSGIFNVSQSISRSYPHIAAYNQKLSEMCDELGVVFLDNSKCLPGDESYYGGDGIHVSRDFYTEVWLPHVYYEVYLG